ncbi:hypothetical protein BGE01nite_49400 [Brevifollis gellanilyticus]|uniref:Uncharacterized protein n=1 Tax=Brevifollis gellanilyticus TaxID=748831 RepID=A0A512MG03_9BACT|nr:hypothetical protein BGE01nite_49400 [Brevifollis gellanilyticus]
MGTVLFYLGILCGIGLVCVHVPLVQRDRDAPGGRHTLRRASFARWFFGTLLLSIALAVLSTPFLHGGLAGTLFIWGTLLAYVAPRRLQYLGFRRRFAALGLLWPLYVLLVSRTAQEPWVTVQFYVLQWRVWFDIRLLANLVFLVPYVWLMLRPDRHEHDASTSSTPP